MTRYALFSKSKKEAERINILEKELRALRCFVGELPHQWTASNRYNNTPVTYCSYCGKNDAKEIPEVDND